MRGNGDFDEVDLTFFSPIGGVHEGTLIVPTALIFFFSFSRASRLV